jgi:hypothetical protein
VSPDPGHGDALGDARDVNATVLSLKKADSPFGGFSTILRNYITTRSAEDLLSKNAPADLDTAPRES